MFGDKLAVGFLCSDAGLNQVVAGSRGSFEVVQAWVPDHGSLQGSWKASCGSSDAQRGSRRLAIYG